VTIFVIAYRKLQIYQNTFRRSENDFQVPIPQGRVPVFYPVLPRNKCPHKYFRELFSTSSCLKLQNNFKEELIMKIVSTIILAVVVFTTSAWAGVVGSAVEVRIISDDGWTLPIYPVKMHHGIRKVYAEAIKGDHYRIEVKNRLNRQVGLVISVDGRNIINGEKSWLKNNERMYILEPYGSGEYAGWRTARDRINRFYFTDVPDSYAAAFGDESAMGVIAIAVYPEVERCTSPSLSRIDPYIERNRVRKSAGTADKTDAGTAAPSASGKLFKEKASLLEQASESAGTGYGRDVYSPSRTVAFETEKRAVETIYLKYEWRSTLCKLGVVTCEQPPRRTPNRLWDDYGYAPPPPANIRHQ
jgi:hypothetical protein